MALTFSLVQGASTKTKSLIESSPSSVGPEQVRLRWDGLPEPVRRYLRYAAPDPAPALRTVHLKHDGFFRTKPDQRWFGIKGEEYFTAAVPGFIWTAKIWPFPLIWISARDLLSRGRGNMLVRLFSLFTLANASGEAIDQGATLRWLGECIWFPFGFVAAAIEWEAIDDRSARATIRSGNVTASAIVTIDEEGKLVSFRADRYRDIGGGKAILTPWTAQCTDYKEIGGFRVPASVEVAWQLETGPFAYARFHVTSLEYGDAHLKQFGVRRVINLFFQNKNRLITRLTPNCFRWASPE